VEAAAEVFRVRGRREATRRTLRFVRHEGVLCPLIPRREGEPLASYRWVGLEPWRGFDAVFGMNRARSVAEFAAALQHFAGPAQNLVVADTTGAYAYFCAGKIPRRPWGEQVPTILDGAAPEHAWGGYLSWEEHPSMVSPEKGYIVTANNRVAKTLPRSLAGGFWEPPYRATRIASLLERTRAAGIAGMAEIQSDVVSLQAAGIVAGLVRPTQAALREPRARQAADLLAAWDFRMAEDSPAAALYHHFYRELVERCIRPIVESRAPGLFVRYLSTLHLAVPAMDTAFLTADPMAFPAGVTKTVEACLAAAWGAVEARLGSDPGAWRWGDLHRVSLQHTLGRGRRVASRLLAWLLGLNRGPFPRPGDGMTVNLSAFLLTEPFEAAAGPSYRQIVDLGAMEESRWIVAGGVSGDFRSRHYGDQVTLWLSGKTRPMRFLDREEGVGAGLRLVPAARTADCAAPSRVL
jgi:penicillin amidase